MARSAFLLCTLVPPLLFLTACDYENGMTGPMQTRTISLDGEKADHANVELDMGAGQLNVRGGADKLVEGTLEFNIPALEPTVRSSVAGRHATVTIRQPEKINLHGNQRYRWDLALNDKVELDLALNCGAGQARMDIGDVDLRSVRVHMGAGQVDLNLEGHPKRDYDVEISGGVGQATVRLPEGVGVKAEAHGGLGSIRVTGLDKRDGYYQNDLWDKAKVNIHLKVQGGIGEIRIIA
ncbi:MAG: hypothetical protein JO217_02755 [Acidobacteriaceae bacterium]|nr:hypothetical protein [Acidobacteriaceae bacterium]